jgi:uncharacterized protein with LGFP repeats
MKLMIGAIAALLAGLLATAPAHAASPYEICQNPLLSRQEQDLCHEQITSAQTVTERKQVQTKFRNRVKAAEDAKKTKK